MTSLRDALAALSRQVAGDTRSHGRAVERARLGRVEQLASSPGTLSARVSSPAGSTQITVHAPSLPASSWSRLARGLAQSVGRFAELAEGALPDDAVLQDLLGAPLVPEAEAVTWEPDDRVAAAAVLQRLAMTADTAGVLAWRGRNVDDLMAEVRSVRGGTAFVVEEADSPDPTRSPAPLPSTHITLSPPVEPEALVRSLGPSPVLGVTDAVRNAAEFAWNLAAGASEEPLSDAVLVAELRALGMATAIELADRLGVGTPDVEPILDALHSAGTVLRAGDRYRAA